MNASQVVRLRTDQRPLYLQAGEAISAFVQRGGYAAGERLPSEVELSRALGISRPTLREGLRLLEESGELVRRHGVGTFVAAARPVIESGLEVLESIERMAERHGLRVEMAEATIVEREASAREAAGLQFGEVVDDPTVTVVTRVIIVDGRRVAHLTDVTPVKYLRRAALLGDGDDHAVSVFHGSVLDLFLARGWPVLAHSRTELIAEAADSDLARLLHVQRGAPLLQLEAQLFAQGGQVVDYSRSYFVPGQFRFHVVRKIG